MKLYRGTQREALKGRNKVTSWTPSKAVAAIYASRPLTDALGYLVGAALQPTSTIHVGEMKKSAKVLRICAPGTLDTSTNCSLWQVMQELDYGKPKGITDDEVLKFLEYLHNRQVGRIEAPRFSFVYFDDYGEPTDEEELELSLFDPQSIIREHVIYEFEDDDPEDVAGRFVADSFVYADSATIRKVARRLGYQVMVYDDVLAGARVAAPELFGCDMWDVPGIEQGWEIYPEEDEEEHLPANKTYRPLEKGIIKRVESMPADEVVGEIRCENPRRRNPAPTQRAANPTSGADLVRRLRF